MKVGGNIVHPAFSEEALLYAIKALKGTVQDGLQGPVLQN